MGINIIHMPQMSIYPNDENSDYIGDGAYAHKDEHGRLWVFTHNSDGVLSRICLENQVMDSLIRFYKNRVLCSNINYVDGE